MMNKILIIFISLLFLNGCSTVRDLLKSSGGFRTSYNVDFKKKLEENKKIMIGKLKIFYHGIEVTKKCSIRFNNDNEVAVLIENDGYIFLSASRGENKLTNVSCIRSEVAPKFYYDFNLMPIVSLVKNVSYIGDIALYLQDSNYKDWLYSPEMTLEEFKVENNNKTIIYFEGKFKIKVQATSLIQKGK